MNYIIIVEDELKLPNRNCAMDLEIFRKKLFLKKILVHLVNINCRTRRSLSRPSC